LRQHKVWIPEGDRFSATALGAFRVTPVPLSLGDVLPGLQTGIIDVVASSPIAVLALQWQTQVHQMTDLPMSYFTGVMVIAKRDFDRLTPADQAVVRSVMTQAFHTLDQHNRQDNLAAYQALVNQGMHIVHPDAGQQAQWKAASQQAIAVLLAQGLVTSAGLAKIRSALAAHP
ncbi:MAG: TRAP transporter substrate-binding protein DctP, partial [Pseudomonadales bacterium]|nr:TRAP transporter substrate-binding protein DctP [Pseudomonadales bacterium]